MPKTGKSALLNTTEKSILGLIVQRKAAQLSQTLPRFREMGLERVIEVIEGWLERGEAEIVEDDVLDTVDIKYVGTPHTPNTEQEISNV